MKERRKSQIRRNRFLVAAAAVLFFTGVMALWVASLRIPALEDLSERKVAESTQIYDRTGEVLLYGVSQGIRRDVVPFEEISDHAKKATLAIEDKEFYNHKGVRFRSFLRALWVNFTSASFKQGGSTITQQVVKNTILTKDKTPTRKFKEWILALKLEKSLTKDQIFGLYLNEIPYGGNVYGIEEASQAFFAKRAKDLTLPQAAYLAALPKAPTYYSPYGKNRDKLDERKNLVLSEMLNQNLITKKEYDEAVTVKVDFKTRENNSGLRAPHFVFYVIDYLAEKYGEDAVQTAGFKVITTLDYNIQQKAEEASKKYGKINEKSFNGKNNASVVIDPKTGDILALVGSRDYFDSEIEGNFNVALAHRQPGSAFKPFVYATMFNKGYTPETILFDVQTQFSTACAPDNFTSEGDCYSPGNYDNKFRGPMTIRNALAQSINVPAVSGLYLAGVRESISLAQSMGIEGLTDPNRYGLTLVLGGGEVSLLDMTSAYGVFANDGLRSPHNPILRVEDGDGSVLEEHVSYPKEVLPREIARRMNSILKDSIARAPLYGPGSIVNIPGREVAIKTGTTNDTRDAWIVGYTPNIVVGTWVGNNDNSPMQRLVSGLIVAPLWREIMDAVLPTLPYDNFAPPEPEESDLKPVLKGEWRGGYSTETQGGELLSGGIHSILHWVTKDNPRGPYPERPQNDPQYSRWEYAVRKWATTQGSGDSDVFIPAATPEPLITDPNNPDPSVRIEPIPEPFPDPPEDSDGGVF